MVKPTPSIPKSLRPKLETYRPEDVRINMPEPDRTPQRTLEATQALSEQMSEMIRVAAEELEHQKREAADNKSYGTLMLRIAVAALIVSIIGSVLSIVVTLLAAG